MPPEKRESRLYYHRLPESWRKENKLDFLSDHSLSTVDWQRLIPNQKHTWRRTDTEDEFESYLPICSKQSKRAKPGQAQTLFKSFSGGVKTNRDMYVYDYSFDSLAKRVKHFVDNYNSEIDRYRRQPLKPEVDSFVNYEKIKWSATLKDNLRRERYANFSASKIRVSPYRPFSKRFLFLDHVLNDRVLLQHKYFPLESSELENRQICISGIGSSKELQTHMTRWIPCYDIIEKGQCFPFYTYDEDGSNRRGNITDYALDQFRRHYNDPAISKWDIFYYVYGLLHHPGYRERYALDLKRNLPRIPFAPAFRPYADAGELLADLHLNYESADRYPLDWASTRKPVSYRVEKMLPKGKVDSAEGNYKVYHTLKYNDTLTLRGIPERAFAYRLGNRSALDWIVDQYRVKTDKRSGITHDPNGYSDDPQYILQLIERVITVSLRTVHIVEGLSKLPFRNV